MPLQSAALEVTLDSQDCVVPIGSTLKLEIGLKNDTNETVVIEKSLGLYPGSRFEISNAMGRQLPMVVTMHVQGDIEKLSETVALSPQESQTSIVAAKIDYGALQDTRALNAPEIPGLYWSFFATAFLIPSLEEYKVQYFYEVKDRSEDEGERESNKTKLWRGKVASNVFKVTIVSGNNEIAKDPMSPDNCKHPIGSRFSVRDK